MRGDEQKAAQNTNREIWRGKSRAEFGDDDRFYADALFIPQSDVEVLGINCGGYVIVKPIREWHRLAALASSEGPSLPDYLRDDAPYIRCVKCGRKSWSGQSGTICSMLQPDNTRCDGEMLPETPFAPAPTFEEPLRERFAKLRELMPTCDKHDYQCECHRQFYAEFDELEQLVAAASPPTASFRTRVAEQDGVALIAAERKRQIEVEGWTPEHDDQHSPGMLQAAARCYAVAGLQYASNQYPVPSEWPWERSWWKPSTDEIKNLVRAGALIAAEIDKKLRAAGAEKLAGEQK